MKRLLPALVSATLLAGIYWRLDWSEFGRALAASRWTWLAAALALVALTTLLSSWRFTFLVPSGTVRLGESLKLTLAASVLNLALPAKAGDLAKAWFVARRGHIAVAPALGLVLFEKAADVLALLVWCAAGLALARPPAPHWSGAAVASALVAALAVVILAPPARLATKIIPARLLPVVEGWRAAQQRMGAHKRRAVAFGTLSVATWGIHLTQVWLFAQALGAAAGFPVTATLAGLALLAGLAPVTLAGIGARDAALVWLFREYLAPEAGAVLGLLCTLRYVIPALAGVPFLAWAAVSTPRAPACEGKTLSRPATRS